MGSGSWKGSDERLESVRLAICATGARRLLTRGSFQEAGRLKRNTSKALMERKDEVRQSALATSV